MVKGYIRTYNSDYRPVRLDLPDDDTEPNKPGNFCRRTIYICVSFPLRTVKHRAFDDNGSFRGIRESRSGDETWYEI